MIKHIALPVLLFITGLTYAQTNPSNAKQPKGDFCTDLTVILKSAISNFDSLKTDTVRATKSIIIESSVLLTDMSMSRISIDRTINQSFYRSFYDGTGNLTTLKSKFEGIKNRIITCVADTNWIEKNDETVSDTEYYRIFTLLENPQDDVTKEYKGRVIELEVEFDIASDTEFTIMLTIANY